jgi:phospholipid/cholesterol/gamma-HCH transport system substrate-binding protein
VSVRIVPALVVAVVAAAAVLALRGSGGSYTVRAEFADAAGLRGHSEVKVGGVEVGTVSSLAVTPHNTAIVTMTVSGSRIGAGARAYVRPVNLLGEKYVDLQLGDQRHQLPSGTLIPPSRTGTPVELDQLLDTLDASTRVRLEILIDSSGQALAGRGSNFGATLAALPPALDQAQAMVGAFAQDNQALGRLVEESDRVIGSMAGQRQALGALLTTASDAFGVLASRSGQLGQTLQQAAPSIGQLRATLARLQQTATALAPAANGLYASAPGIAATLEALPGFAAAARPTLITAERVAPTLTRLGLAATPVVVRLRPVAHRFQEFAAAFGPVSTTFDHGIGNLLGFLEGWARAIQVGDGASHMFRNQLVLSPEIVQRLLSGYLRPAPRSHRRVASAPQPSLAATAAASAPPTPATPLPNLPSVKVPSVKLAGVSRRVQQLVQQLTQTLSSPPNQSSQVSQLLNYLLSK